MNTTAGRIQVFTAVVKGPTFARRNPCDSPHHGRPPSHPIHPSPRWSETAVTLNDITLPE
ncbi:MAG TPA: hypothetical protein PLD25_09990 [Chloroflexota bacterium]|nr:hypothetical protein [Chloroflexota bacterium]